MLIEQLAHADRTRLQRANSVGLAAVNGATRVLHSNFSKHGDALRFEYAVEDLERRKMVETGAVEGSVLSAVGSLARKLDPGAQPFSTPNGEALVAWAHGEFERAVTLDPDFGAAWRGWVQTLARSGKNDEAVTMAERALGRASLRSALNRAQLQLEEAVLRKDEPARTAALVALGDLAPNDPGTALALAEHYQRLRKFVESANYYRRLLAVEPANANALNGLGYALGEGGDIEGAVKALQEYSRLPNQEPNSMDSLGEVNLMNGRFADAEKYFTQLAARAPNFLNGAPLMKAAYARWLAGDLPGADAIMKRYLDSRSSQGDPAIVWRQAVWLFVTGRREAALKKLDEAPSDQKPNLDRQRAVWRGDVHPPEDLVQLKTLYENTNPAVDGLPRVIYAAALAKAGKTGDAKALLQRWPLPESAGDPLLQSLIYPEFLGLRQKLGIH